MPRDGTKTLYTIVGQFTSYAVFSEHLEHLYQRSIL